MSVCMCVCVYVCVFFTLLCSKETRVGEHFKFLPFSKFQ